MGMSKRRFVVWSSLKSEWGNCSWAVLDEDTYPILMVKTHLGTKSTQLGWHPPDLLARILMKEIAAENLPDGY
jgi:hypothetical protein